ncbi:MAG: winged helix-turn-helix domain-containing protein [Pseudomonadota bacterium]
MAQGGLHTETFRLGPLTIIPTQNRIESATASEGLEPKVMDVLCVLADAGGETVSRDTLIDRVWSVEFGADESLSRAISILRKTFRKSEPGITFIETVPKRGYRLVPEVSTIEAAQASPEKTVISADTSASSLCQEKQANRHWPGRLLVWGPALAITLVLGVVLAGRINTVIVEMAQPSLAVLPFEDLSAEKNQQFLVDGLSEEILTALSKVEDIKVSGRSSSFGFRDRALSPNEIGTLLGVNHLLEGSVRRQGNDIRISARLILAADGTQLWSDTFNGKTDDVFSLQETMARRILAQIAPELAPDAASISEVNRHRGEAVTLYLRGKGQSLSRSPKDIQDAIATLQEAVELDPDFAEAHAHLASILAVSAQQFQYSGVEPDAAMARALTSADRAIALDPTLATPHAVRGLKAASDSDFVGAILHLDEALDRNPNHVDALRWKALMHIVLGHVQKSDALLRRAAEFDPQWYVIWQNLAFNNLYLNDYEGVISAYDRALALGMNRIPGVRDPRSEAAFLLGDPDQAFTYWMSNFEGKDGPSDVAQRVLFETIGRALFFDDAAAHEMLENTYQSALDDQGRPPPLLWMPQVGLGNSDRIIDLLADTKTTTPNEKFGFSALAQFIWEPGEGPVAFRNHPRFLEFAETHGLLAAWRVHGWPDECLAGPSSTRPEYCPTS